MYIIGTFCQHPQSGSLIKIMESRESQLIHTSPSGACFQRMSPSIYRTAGNQPIVPHQRALRLRGFPASSGDVSDTGH